MKLFPKLALAISALLLGATVALSATYYLIERRHIARQADQEEQALLLNLVHITQESFLTDDDLLLVKYARWLKKWNPSLIEASVTDRDGQVLAHSDPARIGRRPPAPDPAAGGLRTISAPVRMGAQEVASARLAFSGAHFRAEMNRRLALLKRRVAWVAGPVILVGLLMAFLLAYSWSRGLRALASASAEIGEGRYAVNLSRYERLGDELGILARAFRAMAGRLKELEALKEDFVSAVTHELRSPLGAIESYLNLMQDEIRQGIDPAAWRDYLERMRANTHRLNRFVNDLLDVAAIERGKVTLRLEVFAAQGLLEDVAGLFAARAAERRLTLHREIEEAVPPFRADREKLRQVLVNLVANAIKFSPEGGRVTIAVSRSNRPGRIRVAVQDTGIGISREDQRKIFSKFEQVRSARKSVHGPKGTGLGLAIAKALVELHGGAIGVESDRGKGSCFWFEIPVSPAPAAAPARDLVLT